VGGPEGDMLVAGTGHQTLTGGGGRDQFLFTTDTHAVITDFRPGQDHLVFEEQATSSFHHRNHGHHGPTVEPLARQDQGGAVVTYGSVEVLLQGISADQLTPHDYMLV